MVPLSVSEFNVRFSRAPSTDRAIVPGRRGLQIFGGACRFHGCPLVQRGDHPQQGGSHAVRAADLPRHQPRDTAPRRREQAGLRRVGGGEQDARPHRRGPAGASRERHHRAGAGRQDADHRRPVRRDQGRDRRLRRPGGRRPGCGDRGGLADPSGPPGWRHRDPPQRTVLVTTLEQVFRDQWGRVLAAMIGFLGDFDLAEEAAQEAFAIAAERWPRDGTPANPGAWLATTARNRAIDRLRRDRTLAAKTKLIELPEAVEEKEMEEHTFPDERLELIFTCCHPALALEAQVALTLRTLGGLTTE